MQYAFLNPERLINSSQFEFITDFINSTSRTQLGWHYAIDLTWIYSQVKNWPVGYRVLDAGGGSGPTQFLLAELGFNVTNLDLFLNQPAHRLRNRYQMKFKVADSYEKTTYVEHLERSSTKHQVFKIIKQIITDSGLYQYASTRKHQRLHDQWRSDNKIINDVGCLTWMRANLCNVPEIDSNTFDAVVSLSAIEHIPLDMLPMAWAEILRICKPDVKIAITTSATEQKATWFHQPSQGHCFSEYDLKTLFDAQAVKSNLPASDMLRVYRSCHYLKNNLASFYSKSGDNGMPWGKWNPKYFPVGLFQ
ncbi:MAG: methyltransferase domain-containing protein [Candidatus Polarisedimenticolaceae bacterium]|nr:methyltransferase domain-containing protein [Candidatus Polarisedimenticolaceae bacterium]